MRYLIYLFLFIQCGCVSTKKELVPVKKQSKPNYEYYGKLARQYRGTGLPDADRPKTKTDMFEYEKRLNTQLKKYPVSITRKDAQIYLTFPHEVIFDATVPEPAITPDAYFGVMADFVYVIQNHRNTFIEVKGYGNTWQQGQEMANAFAGYLCLRSVDTRRVTAAGYETMFGDYIEVVLTPL
jgi:hypothetical protein